MSLGRIALSSRATRFAVLICAAAIGASAVYFWPTLHRLTAHAGRPIVSVAAAQREVKFPIVVPRILPGNGHLIGARVTNIESRDRPVNSVAHEEAQEKILKQTSRIRRGFGIEVLNLSGRYSVRSVNGSPAERAGLPSDQLVYLVTVNGKGLSEISDDLCNEDLTKRRIREECGQGDRLVVTVKDSLGRLGTIQVAGEGEFSYPDHPKGKPLGTANKQAALLFEANGRQFSIIESIFEKGDQAFPEVGSPSSRRILIRGQEIWVAGPDAAPGFVWYRNGVHFWLNNNFKALNLREGIELIRSMQ